jgi:hypothetical protein
MLDPTSPDKDGHTVAEGLQPGNAAQRRFW